jgi:Tol biopolymer transport system component
MSSEFAAGTQLGPYRIEAVLGSGGMGEVYRARDTRLGRDVAIKVLREVWHADSDGRSRFEREARLLAALNHPHIASIYGVEETTGGRRALVLELVEGRTLADRLAPGKFAIKETLSIAAQVADGLDAAHERGIIHRDLKPANIKVTPDGRVKILDFGIAKLASAQFDEADVTDALTLSSNRTCQGTLLGTPSYMSPEQARGHNVDKRTDVWAFGCVLYEMLTGRTVFQGETTSDVVAAILTREVDFAALPTATPPAVRKLLQRCLEKDRKRRLHDIADARIEIEDALANPGVAHKPVRGTSMRVMTASAIAALILGGIIGWYFKPAVKLSTDLPGKVARLTITPAVPLLEFVSRSSPCRVTDCGPGTVAISRDGRRIAYTGQSGGVERLYVREIDQFESTPVSGSEGGHTPAFSPDGQSIAFISDSKIKKVSLAGGTPQVLCDSVEGDGLSWAVDDTLLFNPGLAKGVWGIAAKGGIPMAMTRIEGREYQHRFPEFLPNGKNILYSALNGIADEEIYVQSLETGKRRFITKGIFAHYISTGHLAFVQGGTLFTVPFDIDRLQITGTPVAVLQRIQTIADTPQIAFSQTGTIVYLPATGQNVDPTLVWVDRAGREQPTAASGRMFAQPHLAPDGRRVVVSVRAPSSDLWSFDLARGTWSRQTYDGQSSFPVWAPDGLRLVFASAKAGPTNTFWKPVDGPESSEQPLISGDFATFPFSLSSDGQLLAYVKADPTNGQDIWVLPVAEPAKQRPFLQTRFREGAPQFSPDGRWIAYVSDESGRTEIYVRPFPGPGEKWTVSSDGGNEPVWARKSKELFYRSGDAMMVVDVATNPSFSVGKPRQLFQKPYERSGAYWANYDVTADGQQLLMVKGAEQIRLPSQMNIVLNWFEDLKQRAPVK